MTLGLFKSLMYGDEEEQFLPQFKTTRKTVFLQILSQWFYHHEQDFILRDTVE